MGPGGEYGMCPFMVGDLISYPTAGHLAYRVKWRMWVDRKPGHEAYWLVGIEQARHPMSE